MDSSRDATTREVSGDSRVAFVELGSASLATLAFLSGVPTVAQQQPVLKDVYDILDGRTTLLSQDDLGLYKTTNPNSDYGYLSQLEFHNTSDSSIQSSTNGAVAANNYADLRLCHGPPLPHPLPPPPVTHGLLKSWWHCEICRQGVAAEGPASGNLLR